MEIDIEEMERQRYNSIKKSDKYLELNILIGEEKEEFENGHKGRVPVVKTTMIHCSTEVIMALYSTLQSLINHYEEKYPVECFLAKHIAEASYIGEFDNSSKDEEQGE